MPVKVIGDVLIADAAKSLDCDGEEFCRMRNALGLWRITGLPESIKRANSASGTGIFLYRPPGIPKEIYLIVFEIGHHEAIELREKLIVKRK